ncbi:glycogen-binding domain-containing protein [Acidiferrobacter sp.]|uniref:glycogen-binding domain-containing protein n=1 Tax=Acidiferrobacter sp. TaxID=1872107 RepID=UPI0026081B61|nr:glycogen-binding domain-containing protein [Acidiferrobacter sp.]
MADETDRSLSEGEIGAALKRWPQPVVADDFVDRVMARIEVAERRRARRGVRRVWAIAAGIAIVVLAATVLLRAGTSLAPGTRLVRFTLRMPQASQVAMAGSFNGWGRRVALHARGHGLWTVRIPLRAGQYSYVFVVNGHHVIPDPHAEGYRPDGFGGQNSIIIVGSPRMAA